jgi:hypothetical protein
MMMFFSLNGAFVISRRLGAALPRWVREAGLRIGSVEEHVPS